MLASHHDITTTTARHIFVAAGDPSARAASLQGSIDDCLTVD